MELKFEEHDSSLNIKANIMVLIVWFAPFVLNIFTSIRYLGFIIPIVFLLLEKKSELVRRHASQALVINLIQFVLYLVFYVVFASVLFGGFWLFYWFFSGIFSLVNIGILVIAILQAIKGYQWTYLNLPIIGNLAESIEKLVKLN